MHPHPTTDPHQFWEDRYASQTERQRGKAGKFLQTYVSPLPPGKVLELGCSTGDDSLWLAEQGWQVTGADISPSAIATATRLAAEHKLSDHIHFVCADLSEEALPTGAFDLVTALYFQSPFEEFPRGEIIHKAAHQLKPGGHLLVVSHAAGPPWSEHADHKFPTLEEEFASFNLDPQDWEQTLVQVLEREATGPEGQKANLKDNLIFLKRKP